MQEDPFRETINPALYQLSSHSEIRTSVTQMQELYEHNVFLHDCYFCDGVAYLRQAAKADF